MYFYNKKYLRETRKKLRNEATLEEKILWEYLKNSKLGYKFRRQHSIGSYIADFCCPLKKLIIEVDGEYHLDNKTYDVSRTESLNLAQYKVLRFWNTEIRNNVQVVLHEIRSFLTPTP